jgi:short-subunit dehydrogenase
LEVAKSCVSRCTVMVADMTKREEVERVVRDTIGAAGGIDVWVNNVGRGITKMPSELTDQDIDDMMTVNVKSALYGIQSVLPHFKERGSGQVVNVSSLLGRAPFATHRSAYCGAKHFLNALTANFRQEFATSHPGIKFTLVSPGLVWTHFGLNALHGGADSRSYPDGQTSEEVAEVIEWAILEKKEDVYTKPAKAMILGYMEKLGQDPTHK